MTMIATMMMIFLFFCTTLIIAHAIPCFFASSSIHLIPAYRPRIEPKKKLVQENLSLELDHGMFIVCAKNNTELHVVIPSRELWQSGDQRNLVFIEKNVIQRVFLGK